jgi:hypothetical protein
MLSGDRTTCAGPGALANQERNAISSPRKMAGLLAGSERKHGAERLRALALPECPRPLVPSGQKAAKQAAAPFATLEAPAARQHQCDQIAWFLR